MEKVEGVVRPHDPFRLAWLGPCRMLLVCLLQLSRFTPSLLDRNPPPASRSYFRVLIDLITNHHPSPHLCIPVELWLLSILTCTYRSLSQSMDFDFALRPRRLAQTSRSVFASAVTYQMTMRAEPFQESDMLEAASRPHFRVWARRKGARG